MRLCNGVKSIMNITIQIPQLDTIINQQLKIIQNLESFKHKNIIFQEWYTLREAEALKGACNHGTLLKIREYQPKGGIPDTYMHGTKPQNKVWHRDSIIEWLGIHDGNRAGYLRKYGIYVSKILEQKWKGAA